MSLVPAAKKTVPVPPHEDVWRDAGWRSRLRRKLVGWFDRNSRDLPWRHDPQPYRVWISEIMLQQTQVTTVVPFYKRFLKSFPTVHELAAADEQSLLAHWEGLGYYRRARSMHAAAKRIASEHAGKFPDTFDEVMALPGIGRYTAGAILSISLDQRLPILEGNTQRVFSRWVAMRAPVDEAGTTKLLWQIATTMLPRKGVGRFNQAAMELGAMICTPKLPKCDQCPVLKFCAAQRAGLAESIPGKVTRVAYEDRSEFALIVQQPKRGKRSRRYLVRPLPAGVRWAGLWDFPRSTDRSLDSADEAAEELSKYVGGTIAAASRLTTNRHAVTKYRITLHVHEATLGESDHKPPPPWRFVTLRELADLPMSATGRKIAKLLSP